uniref:Collagen alpha-1(XII) chain-like n=1 Tax=Gouania willdenowi TaxID=441366 RepID=A0A8C5E3M3_GOUWI
MENSYRTATAFLALLLLCLSVSQAQNPVEPPSGLRFKILNENTVQMLWSRTPSNIHGYRIQVTSDTGEMTKDLTLPASATKTSISDLSPDEDYIVTIVAFAGSDQSLPLSGRITSECQYVLFLIDGSWTVGRPNFRYIRSLVSAVSAALSIGADRSRVGVVQYGDDARHEFRLNQHMTRPSLIRAINSLPYKGGNTHTGLALDFVLKNGFTEASGARNGFPKVLLVVTDGRSEDSVQIPARQLRNRGVEIFVVGVHEADEEEMKLMASTPHRNHIFTVASFDSIRNVQKALITQVCAGVDDQLNSLVSGEEAVEPASDLQVLEVASKSMRLTWGSSIGDVSGYKVQLVPMIAGSKRHDLYVGPEQKSVVVRDLSPDTEYEISLFALNGLTPSEPLSTLQKTLPVKVSVECSLGVDVQADVVLLVDGSYSIGLANFAKVRAFLEVLVNTFDIGRDKVQISLVQYSREPYTEFYLNTHHDLSAVVKAVRTFPYRGGSTNTGKAMTYVREKVFLSSRGARANVPRVTILLTDGKSSDAFQDPATRLRNSDVEIFAVGVKDAVRAELEAIANAPSDTHVYKVEDFDSFQRISRELTQSVCLRIEQELQNILAKPKALTFSEVGAHSFRASWDIDTDNVQSYLVQFRPEDDQDGHFVSMSVPGDTRTAVLPQLTPDTRYQVKVFAQYQRGDSTPVTSSEKTLQEQGPVRNLRVSEETTDSFRVSWQAAPGAVARYRLSYAPVGELDRRLDTSTNGSELTLVLQNLQPRTTYRVSVTPEYQSGAGSTLACQRTVESKGPLRELFCSASLSTTKSQSWNCRLLRSKLFSSSFCKQEVGPPRDLVTSDVSDRSFSVSWTAAPGNVKMYRVRWKSQFSDELGEKLVPGRFTNTVLDNLRPETLYQVSVTSAYEHTVSEPITGQETTDASAVAKSLAVSEETERSMRVTWSPAPGKVLHYRLKYVPKGGGAREVVLKVPASLSSTVLKRLQPSTTYAITVAPIYRRGEGKARQGVGTTLSPYKSPRNLQTSESTKNSFRVSWDPAPGNVQGYKVTFHPRESDVDLGELLVGPYDNTVVLEELRAGTEYSVSVFGMFEGGQSLPLAGEEKTTLTEDPDTPAIAPSDTQCKSSAKADIVVLVDGSWSIGRINFKTIRNFIGRMVSVFDIRPDRVQIGLSQYSGDPKTEWQLNAHSTKESLLKAVSNLPYKGGNTNTGMALNHILDNNFQPSMGMRADSRKIGILITDGKSQDEVVLNSQRLRDSGIELYAIGVKNADENELRSIATDPDEIHMYNVNDFKFLISIVDDLTVNLCNSVKGSDEPELKAPNDLVTSEVTHRSFRASWTPPGGPVEKYRVVYMVASGGPTTEMLVDGSVTSVVLENLQPLTQYLVNVYSVVGEQSSEPLKGTETTLPLSAVKNMNVYDETSTTMRVSWDAAPRASSYMLLYRTLNASEPQLENEVHSDLISDVTHSSMKLAWDAAPGEVRKYIITYSPEEGERKEVEVDGAITSRVLKSLISQTEYDVAVTPVYDKGPAAPLLGNAITDVVPAPKRLQFSEVTQDSFKVTWDHGAPDVALYRFVWTKKDENNSILSSDETSQVLENLDPDTEYSVTVTAIYPDESESEDLMGSERTRNLTRCLPLNNLTMQPPRNLRVFNATTSSLSVRWDPVPIPVQNYRVSYMPVTGGETKTVRDQIPTSTTSIVLRNLTPDTPYSVSVLPVYPAREGKRQTEDGHTLPLSGIGGMRVTNPTFTTLDVTWNPADGNVQGYKVVYTPADGGLEIVVRKPDTTSTVLTKLMPDTRYAVSVVPVYAEGDGPSLSDVGKTRPLGFVRNLQVTDPTTSTLNVRWDPPEGKVREIRTLCVFPGQEQVSGTSTSTVLKDLTPDTDYTVTVVPVYPEMEGKPQSDTGKTNPLGGVRNLKVSDPTISSLTVRWDPAVGNVRSYKLFYAAEPGGAELVEEVSGGTSSTVLRNLDPDTLYNVAVVPVYPDTEGIRQAEKGRTRESITLKHQPIRAPCQRTSHMITGSLDEPIIPIY